MNSFVIALTAKQISTDFPGKHATRVSLPPNAESNFPAPAASSQSGPGIQKTFHYYLFLHPNVATHIGDIGIFFNGISQFFR